MFGRLMPREGQFFTYFNDHAGEAVACAREFIELLRDLKDPSGRTRAIETHEKRADKITHDCIDLLHKTFITPLDRDDIHTLITRMDDILDLMEDAAQSFTLYDVKASTPEAVRLAEVNLACVEKVQAAVALLDNMGNSQQIHALCADIDKLESEADHIHRNAIAKLFREEPDVREVIKLKVIYEVLESVTDRCEDVANIIEGILVENA